MNCSEVLAQTIMREYISEKCVTCFSKSWTLIMLNAAGQRLVDILGEIVEKN
jgi:hypothetical protein